MLIECTHHGIEKLVGWSIASYFLAVFECDLFVAGSVYRYRTHTEGYLTLGPRRIDIPLVRPNNQSVRNGRMVARLLHEQLRAIGTAGLVRLAQQWIQWLLKLMAMELIGHS
jgi:hypothetical protein